MGKQRIGEATHSGNPTSLVGPGAYVDHQRDAQCWTIEITGVVLAIAAAILGGWALFSAPVWRWFLVSASLLSALAAMAVGINAEWLAALDVSVETWFEAHRSRRGLIDAKGIFRFVGSPAHVVSAAVVCGTLLSLGKRSATPGFLVVGGVGFGVVVEQVFKAMVGRTSTAVAELQGRIHGRSDLLYFEHSFPSGHVTGSAVFLGMIALCLGSGRGRAVKVALEVPVLAGVLFVAFVAVYAEAHTFSDVIGGMILGGVIVSLGAAVLGATHYSRRDSTVAPVNDP